MLITILQILCCAVCVWNLVMMIMFFVTRKKGGENHEKARSRFVISSAFFISVLTVYAAVQAVVWIFIEPITFM